MQFSDQLASYQPIANRVAPGTTEPSIRTVVLAAVVRSVKLKALFTLSNRRRRMRLTVRDTKARIQFECDQAVSERITLRTQQAGVVPVEAIS